MCVRLSVVGLHISNAFDGGCFVTYLSVSCRAEQSYLTYICIGIFSYVLQQNVFIHQPYGTCYAKNTKGVCIFIFLRHILV